MSTITRAWTTVIGFSLTGWFDALMTSLIVRFVDWAFSKRAVQNAVVEHITCDTPIGRALNSHIEGCLSDLDPGDISGLEHEINDAIERYERDLEIDANNIKGLEREVAEILDDMDISEKVEETFRASEGVDDLITNAIEEKLDELADDTLNTKIGRLVAQRLSY